MPPQPHHHIDAPDFRAGRRRRQTIDRDIRPRNVRQGALIFMVEVLVINRVRVEVAAGRIDHHLEQQSCLGELVQGVVHGGERHLDAFADGFGMQGFGSQMAMSVAKQQFRQFVALPCRSEPRLAKTRNGGFIGELP